MRKIAKHFGMSTSTVSKILKTGQTETKPIALDGIVERIVPKAFEQVEKAIDTGDSALAMRYLERTALADGGRTQFNVSGDVRFQQITALLPGPVTAQQPDGPPLAPIDVPSLAYPAMTAGPTEAAEKPTQDELCVSSHTNFSQFLAACPIELIEQELARRKTCGHTEAAQIQEADPVSAQAQRGPAPVEGLR